MKLLIALLFTFAWPLHAASPKHLIIIGDSITEGFGVSHDQAYPALLQKKIDKLNKNWLVVGSGISGSTTASAPSRVQWHVKQKPALIILALGANDGLRGLPLGEIRKNLVLMIRASRDAGASVVLAGIELPINYGPQYRDGLRAIYRDLAAEFNLPLVPFLLDGVALNPELMQDDGLHPKAAGEPKVLENVWPVLEPALEKLD